MSDTKVISLDSRRTDTQSFVNRYLEISKGLKHFNEIAGSINKEHRKPTNEELDELTKIMKNVESEAKIIKEMKLRITRRRKR